MYWFVTFNRAMALIFLVGACALAKHEHYEDAIFTVLCGILFALIAISASIEYLKE